MESQLAPEGWHDETATREQALKDFVGSHFQNEYKERENYGSAFHLSGGGGAINYKDLTGQIVRIEVLYEQGKVTQIHGILRAQRESSGNTDVYLTGKALEDFLALETKRPGSGSLA